VPGLEGELDAVVEETGFSGVIRVDHAQEVEIARAYGLASRGYGIPNTVDTRFGLASGTKALTALAVASLVEEGLLGLDTTARSLLGDDLPLVGDDVTVEHLLAHRSGIGDYLDEDVGVDVTEYLLPVSVHELATTEQYLAVLEGHPPKFAPDERFAYCNGGYVVLALIAERASGIPFHELVQQRVCAPAGMVDTAFLRSDDLPGRVALGYLEVDGAWRTNVLHLPVRGNGDIDGPPEQRQLGRALPRPKAVDDGVRVARLQPGMGRCERAEEGGAAGERVGLGEIGTAEVAEGVEREPGAGERIERGPECRE
jgi:CubicO group peptidase (beta-lactamase class C family)